MIVLLGGAIVLVVGILVAFWILKEDQDRMAPRPQSIPPPVQHGPFDLTVEDVFSIAGRGTVVTGKIAAGSVQAGTLLMLHHAGQKRQVTVVGIEAFRKVLDQAGPGEQVGLLLKEISREDVQPGDRLTGV